MIMSPEDNTSVGSQQVCIGIYQKKRGNQHKPDIATRKMGDFQILVPQERPSRLGV